MIKLFILFSFYSFLSWSNTDLYYEIHIDEIEKIIENKFSKTEERPFCKVYSYRGKFAVEVEFENENLKNIIKEICEAKHRVIQGSVLDDLLLNFEFKEKYSQYNVYVDKTGVAEINEIWVSKNKSMTEIIEKRSIGTTRIKYKYQKSRLKEAIISSFEGSQSIESNHTFNYFKSNKSDKPDELVSKYTQKLSKRDIGEFKRSFNEKIMFRNYKVDKNIALNYFNKN